MSTQKFDLTSPKERYLLLNHILREALDYIGPRVTGCKIHDTLLGHPQTREGRIDIDQINKIPDMVRALELDLQQTKIRNFWRGKIRPSQPPWSRMEGHGIALYGVFEPSTISIEYIGW